MDKNFRVRVTVGVCMFIVALVALNTFDGLPFKIIFGIFACISAIELLSFFKRRSNNLCIILAILEMTFLFYSTMFVTRVSVDNFWFIILGVPGYDIFAYLFGKLFGGKLFKKSRPFPRISKNKTWEGTVLGLIASVGMVAILMAARGTFTIDWMYLFCGPLALIGDLFESFLKRVFGVKDSNEILIKNKFFSWLEMFVGGSEGHGGFLDRIDSTAFACSILFVMTAFV